MNNEAFSTAIAKPSSPSPSTSSHSPLLFNSSHLLSNSPTSSTEQNHYHYLPTPEEYSPIEEQPIHLDKDEPWLEVNTITSEQDAERALNTQSLAKLHYVHHQLGYREGQSKGYQDALQKNFDQGYAVGFQSGLAKGNVLGRIRMTYLFQSLHSPPSESHRLHVNQLLQSLSCNAQSLEDIETEFLKLNDPGGGES